MSATTRALSQGRHGKWLTCSQVVSGSYLKMFNSIKMNALSDYCRFLHNQSGVKLEVTTCYNSHSGMSEGSAVVESGRC